MNVPDAASLPMAPEARDGGTPDAGEVWRALNLELAPRTRASLDLGTTLGVVPTVIRAAGPGLLATLSGAELRIDVLRGARGQSQVVVDTEDGEAVRVNVSYTSARWAFVDDLPHVARLAESPANVSSEAWALVEGILYGTRVADGEARTFANGGDLELIPLPLPPDATQTWARHYRQGALWGAVARDGQVLPASFDESGQANIVDLGVDAEFFSARGALRVGTAWIEGSPRAVVCTGGTVEDCRDVSPPGSSAASAREVDVDGRVYGCATVDGESRAFVESPGVASVLLPGPERGCISGVDETGRLLGEFHRDDEDHDGVVLDRTSGQAQQVRVGRSWGTRLLSSSGSTLLGAARLETGMWRAMRLEPVSVPDGVRYQLAPEPEDPNLAHACGHVTQGPFSSITAATFAAEAIRRTHSHYTIALPADQQARKVQLVNPREGRVTLHLGVLMGVRLRSPSGAVVPAVYADDTTRCEGLRGFVQYDLEETGTYELELGPTERESVNVVYERTWVTEPH